MKALTIRAIRVCSKNALPGELLTLKNILEDNGYPSHVVDRTMRMTKEKCVAGKAGCAVDLDDNDHCRHASIRLPWIGDNSKRFGHWIRTLIIRAFPSASPRVIF